jgi:hypothetical protein
MTDDELMRCFEAGEPPPGGFHHEAHVRAAWCCLRGAPLQEALARFRSGLQRFAAARGKPERYHETITTAYVLLIHGRVLAGKPEMWEAFAERNRDLLEWNPSILTQYYTQATLDSDAARRTFVPPDLKTFQPTRTAAPTPDRREPPGAPVR